MKRITFTEVNLKVTRHDWPGYLYLHPNHPGREFVIARGSKTVNGTLCESAFWNLYDRASGVIVLNGTKFPHQTERRRTMEARAAERLTTFSPEQVAKYVGNQLAKIATARLAEV